MGYNRHYLSDLYNKHNYYNELHFFIIVESIDKSKEEEIWFLKITIPEK
jgi:hypothetical protein